MSTVRSRAWMHAAALVALAASPLQAQQADADGTRWLDRISVTLHGGELLPAGNSEFFALIDRALAPGSGALRPRLLGVDVSVHAHERWQLRLGLETGGRTIASVSRVAPLEGQQEILQQTTWKLASVQQLGAEWRAYRWQADESDGRDRLRVLLGAGAGLARYALRQWGGFVDAERRVAYDADFSSAGRGGFGYLSAAVEVPVHDRLALRLEARRQAGSARMSDDYASFDRIDLGGTKLSVGARMNVAGGAR